MDRKEFFKTCAYACLSGIALTTIVQSCTTSKILSLKLEGSDFFVNLSEFEIKKKDQISYRKYIIVQNEALNFPIVVYRFSASEFKALNLQCTHQGAELQVFGDKIVCPAHGSEFNNKGLVEQGPAINQLRSFPIQITDTKLKISLV